MTKDEEARLIELARNLPDSAFEQGQIDAGELIEYADTLHEIHKAICERSYTLVNLRELIDHAQMIEQENPIIERNGFSLDDLFKAHEKDTVSPPVEHKVSRAVLYLDKVEQFCYEETFKEAFEKIFWLYDINKLSSLKIATALRWYLENGGES